MSEAEAGDATNVQTEQKPAEVPAEQNSDVKAEEKSTDVKPEPDLPKILKQMEYYFGNHNLLRDKFLKEKIKEDDGWVSLEGMLKFNRLNKLTSDTAVIVDALKDSELIEVNEAKDKVRRSPAHPLPEDNEEYKKQLTARTVYAKGFRQDSKLDELIEFFKQYGGSENVFMRRDFYKNIFKGSVFTTFKTLEDAQKFIDEAETKYEDKVLEVKLFKDDYFKNKMEERKNKRPNKEKKDTDNSNNSETKDDDKSENKETDEERAKRQMTQNAILHFKGNDPETTVGEMKDFFREFGEVGYVDYEKGQTEGYLRMKEPNSATPTLEKLKAGTDGKIMIKDAVLEMRVVEGDEELQYWTRMMKDVYTKYQKNRRNNFGRGGGRGRGGKGRGGGRGRGGKRKFGNDGGNVPAKVAKTD